jgi:hypothetical protein
MEPTDSAVAVAALSWQAAMAASASLDERVLRTAARAPYPRSHPSGAGTCILTRCLQQTEEQKTVPAPESNGWAPRLSAQWRLWPAMPRLVP